MPADPAFSAVTARSWLAVFHVNAADPPNPPPELNWTLVFAPPGVPPLPLMFA